jgi:hypothetical protein
MEKNEWQSQFIKNIEKYDQYKIVNINPRCYDSYPCFHKVLISFNNEEQEVLMRGDEIGYYQKHHGKMSLHFMNYISNDKN